jgi:hypothetical protein
MEKPPPSQKAEEATTPPPWYESNLLWGPLALSAGIILTVVAAMKHDLRWLLWFAWPCFCVSIWWLARRTREIILVSILGAVLSGVGLLWLSSWLKPQQIASVLPVTPTAPPTNLVQPTSVPKGASPAEPKVVPKPKVRAPLKGSDNSETPKVQPQNTVPAPPPVNYAPNGFAVSGGTLINPQVNNLAPVDRHVTADQITTLKQLAKMVPLGVSFGVRSINTPDATTYAKEIHDALHSENASIDYLIFLVGGDKGIRVVIRDENDPSFKFAQTLATTLNSNGIPIASFQAWDQVPANTVWLYVGTP